MSSRPQEAVGFMERGDSLHGSAAPSVSIAIDSWRSARDGPYVEFQAPVRCAEICFCIKVAVLLVVLFLGYLTCAQGLVSGSAVHVSLGAFAFLNALRVCWQMTCWRRDIHWLEATVEMLVLFPLSVAIIVYMPLADRVCDTAAASVSVCTQTAGQGACLLVGTLVYTVGLIANVEIERYMLSIKARGVGLVSTGPYAVCRHPNYCAEIVIWAGGAIAGGTRVWVGLLVVVFPMAVGMHFWSVRDLEDYLQQRYGSVTVDEWRARTPSAIWPCPRRLTVCMRR